MDEETPGYSFENHAKEIYKQVFSINKSREDGLLLQIHHTIMGHNKKSKKFKFNLAAFDDTGEQLVTADHVGNVFVVDFACFRFWMLPKPLKCSVLKFSTYRKNEVLIGRPDGSIDLVDTGSGTVNVSLLGHEEPVSDVTFASGEPFCLTVSAIEAIIWNLSSNSKLHKLTLHSNVSYRQILFIPVSNKIFACFSDNTVHIWKSKTFECVKHALPYKWNNKVVSSLSVTRDGQTIAIGGSCSMIILMSLATWKLKKALQLPNYITSIKHLEFVPQPLDGGSNKIIAVLSHSNSVLIFDTETSNLLSSIDQISKRVIKKFTCSVNGKYLAASSDTGELNIYSASILVTSSNITDLLKSEHERAKPEHIKHSSVISSKSKQLKISESRSRESRLEKLNHKMEAALDIGRLKQILEEFSEYPENYRSLIWKSILRLPLNQLAYNALQNKGLHPVCRQKESIFPTKNAYLSNSLKRLMSCLSYWSPLFSQLTYLPNLVSPFLRVFKSNHFVCFEFVATFIVNWCQRWFEFFPFPPVNIMSMIENILVEWDEELFNWFIENQVTSHQYGWTVLQSVFSEVLSEKEWLQLFDHILSNEPSFMIFAIVAYIIVCRSTLLKIKHAKDFDFFFHNQTAIDMRQFIKKIYQLYHRTEDDETHPRFYLHPFMPLEPGETYQIFNEYPKFIVDKQADHINAMREEFTELLREQSRLARFRAEQEKKQAFEINRQAQKTQLLNLQKQYQDVLKEEENRVSEQVKKIKAMKRDLKRRELIMMEETRNRTQDFITQQRTATLQALLRDLDNKRAGEEKKLKEIEEETLERHQQLLLEKKLIDEQLSLLAEVPIPIAPEHDELAVQLAQLTDEMMKIREENSKTKENRSLKMMKKLSAADSLLQKAEFELAQEAAERQKAMFSGLHNIQAIKLENETKELQKDVDLMLNNLVEKRMHESWDLIKAAEESKDDRRVLHKELFELTEVLKNNSNDNSDDYSSASSQAISDKKYYQPCSSLNPDKGNDLRGKRSDHYRKQQDAIKSSIDVRQRLLSSRK